jgi:hypothetical protein
LPPAFAAANDACGINPMLMVIKKTNNFFMNKEYDTCSYLLSSDNVANNLYLEIKLVEIVVLHK